LRGSNFPATSNQQPAILSTGVARRRQLRQNRENYLMLTTLAFRHTHAFTLLLLAITFASMPTKASMPSWQGVEIRRFAQASSNPLLIFAVGQGYLYGSKDGGKSWAPMRVPVRDGLTIEWANVDPLNERRLLVLARDQTANRNHLFYETEDEGKTWKSMPPSTIALPKPFPNSTVVPHVLQRGTKPMEWNPALLDTGYSIDDSIIQIGEESFFLKDRTLWALGIEKRWEIRYQFPPADAASSRFTYTNLLALENSVLVVRQPNGNWLQSADSGHTWADSISSFQTLNAGLTQPASTKGAPGYGETRCRVQASPASSQVLIATCVWDNRVHPSRTCLHHSADGGSSWLPPLASIANSVSTCSSDGLPSAWAPTALLMDKFNPKQLLIAWMAGGIFRSEDGGQSWTSSDQGLLFRDKHGGPFDFIAMAEPLPIRAVLYRDLEYLDQLISQGASINEPGNKLSGVLDAELTVLEDKRLGKAPPSLWAELRARGANVNPPEGRRSNFFKRALALQAPDIVNDLISAGYDWGRPTTEFKFGESISTEVEALVSSTDPLKRQVLENFVNAYIRADKFPAADVTVREMLENKEASKAVRILRAATKKTAFDKQSTPPRVDRLQLAMLLVQANKPEWARRLFLVAKQSNQLVLGDGYWGLVQKIRGTCNPKEAAWYVAQGMHNLRLDNCLNEFEFPDKSARLNILKYMIKSQSIDAEDWSSFLQKSSHKWILHTQYHRLFERELKFLPYAVVGVKLDGLAADSQVLGNRNYLRVTGLSAGYSAQLEGIQIGDAITHVDGKDTAGLQFPEVRKLLIGKAGSSVNVRILRGTETKVFKLVRKPN
jgi:photosystem II stability/assembly factor-like uncharacterized protein